MSWLYSILLTMEDYGGTVMIVTSDGGDGQNEYIMC